VAAAVLASVELDAADASVPQCYNRAAWLVVEWWGMRMGEWE